MKSLPSPGSSFFGIEPLEARIAPARIIIGGNPNSTADTEYTDAPFVDTETSTSAIATSLQVTGAVGVADTFYLSLSAGDKLLIFNTTSGPEEYLTVKSGNVVAFFFDRNGNNEVEEGELMGLSLGKDASVVLKGGLEGDIVANLDGDRLDMSGATTAQQGIKGISVGNGNVGGKIIAGGNISNVSVNGTVGAILAGSAVSRLHTDGEAFDFFPGIDGGSGTLKYTMEAGKIGSSISNVFVDGIGNTKITGDEARLEAGGGGAGAAGGAIKNIRIMEDATGLSILAGSGGAGASGKINGGVGGSVSGVYIAGAPETSETLAGDLIRIAAGHGGDATSAGIGGKGGAVSKVFVGYQLIGNKPFQTLEVLADRISVEAGFGGSGRIGGAGGGITRVDLLTTADHAQDEPEEQPALVAVPQHEIALIAGAGGASVASGGKAGVGGSISSVRARDVLVEPLDSTIATSVLLQGGAGGAAASGAAGARGGSVSAASLVGADFHVLAGNGSSGKIGGAGGSVSDITLLAAPGIIPHNATFAAGTGGDGTAGAGGVGGSIKTIRNTSGDFALLQINPGTAGDGGNSVGARGANGGSVSGLNMFDGYTDTVPGSLFSLRSGDGGDGTKGGGNGGAINKMQFTGIDISVDVRAGAGGAAAGAGAAGKGGLGGSVSAMQLQTNLNQIPDPGDPSPITASVKAGAGGAGKTAGGRGGSVNGINLVADGSSSVIAGTGGNGETGASGAGGSILNTGVFANFGAGQMLAGDAGANGDAPGAGGSIRGASNARLTGLYASTDLEVRAGNGAHGGAGGSIAFFGYGSTSESLMPMPSGNIIVQAGNGSVQGRIAGAGGSILNVNGSVASGDGSLTLVAAGNGAGGTDGSSAGGSIRELNLLLGGGATSEVRVKAGDAGDGGAGVRTGAKGGDVRGVYVSDLNPALATGGPIIRSIAAGDGGNAANQGGVGGSVTEVRVLNHDIGVRSGERYGYETMGGIFAGAGGTGAGTAGKGNAGNVSGVSASAIAAIVAGRGDVPELVERVEKIYVFTPQATATSATNLLRASEGDLVPAEDGGAAGYRAFIGSRYATANLVGAVYDPTRVDGNKFDFEDVDTSDAVDGVKVFTPGVDKPIDGLIAAKTFVQATVNFTPEARLIGSVLYDYDNLT